MDNLSRLGITLDDWQEKFIKTKGDKMLCTGRQVGKSVTCAIDAGRYAVKNQNKSILMIAPTERQAYGLFEKTLEYLMQNHRLLIKKGRDRPTKHIIKLKNNTRIYCYPTGVSGLGIRGLTINRLYVDEASRVPEEVWTAITPMLLTTGGSLIMLSTPFGRQGYFFEMWNDAKAKITKFSATSEEVIKKRPISKSWTKYQREKALEYLEREKTRMSKLEFAQEYLGEFLQDIQQFFPDELIKKCMTAERPKNIQKNRNYYLGVDIARMGEDESTFEIVKKVNPHLLIQVENKVTTRTYLTETSDMIKSLNRLYDFKNIYIDDEGIGIGVFDELLHTEETKRKVIGINNSKRTLDREGKRTKKLLKQDLYNNLRRLMERGEIHLLNDADIFQSLKSVQYEYMTTQKGEPILKIYGTYTHIAEGLIRAAWCVQGKDINIWVRSIRV